MNAKILIKKNISSMASISPVTAYDGFMLSLEVVETQSVSSKIFVMQRDVESNYSAGYVDRFYSIASVGEIAWIPEDAPDEPLQDTNFFRVDRVDIVFETFDEAEAGWNKIKSEVYHLQRAASNFYAEGVESLVPVGAEDHYRMFHGITGIPISGGSDVRLHLTESGILVPYLLDSPSLPESGVIAYAAVPHLVAGPFIITRNGVDITDGANQVVSITFSDGIQVDYTLAKSTPFTAFPADEVVFRRSA